MRWDSRPISRSPRSCSASACSASITRRNTIGILLGIELMLNAVNINLVAFCAVQRRRDRHGLHASSPSASPWPRPRSAWRIVILLFRIRRTVMADHLDLLKG